MLEIVFAVMQGTAGPVPDMMLINLLIVRNIDNATVLFLILLLIERFRRVLSQSDSVCYSVDYYRVNAI